jgi:DNA-binding GntR family transcriptional regulator
LRRSLRDSVSRSYTQVSLVHHQELIQALRERDGARAADAVRADIRDAAGHFPCETEREEDGSAA